MSGRRLTGVVSGSLVIGSGLGVVALAAVIAVTTVGFAIFKLPADIQIPIAQAAEFKFDPNQLNNRPQTGYMQAKVTVPANLDATKLVLSRAILCRGLVEERCANFITADQTWFETYPSQNTFTVRFVRNEVLGLIPDVQPPPDQFVTFTVFATLDPPGTDVVGSDVVRIKKG
jgi:hypothetical protein